MLDNSLQLWDNGKNYDSCSYILKKLLDKDLLVIFSNFGELIEILSCHRVVTGRNAVFDFQKALLPKTSLNLQVFLISTAHDEDGKIYQNLVRISK